uniref:EF-hand domain-containing protein n=1 Tax=Picochlorum oklahomense TaxID=249345 RepID=A0A7S1CVA2_9CHLO|mmetsp:Transcript_461/g.1067  ORF Transcript_461/g.1067 Transcript_461/m.1067 type:complete len:178 (+) Transcript_461:75-608(+)|eukprot:CAMPEP_0118807670 /NCGR_PEP_ID=MMETSP1161-20130426/35594_1 /TAXON_ID=249345 /ORGANISM="Picochlorum oklahomensis, Strain CCMP2329" /LENGTH=177 /DNA_ID=CAMNT_0006737049 /DNA_START=11 /DNA_END=544 /DNA_ORIENTATION=+
MIPESDLESKAVYDQQLSELKQAFGTFDTDGSGTIAKDELQACLNKMGVHPTPAELDHLYQSMDKDGDGVITFQEFLTVMTDEFEEAELEHELEEMKQFFTMMDKDGSGRLSPEELKNAISAMGVSIRDDECRYLCQQMIMKGGQPLSSPDDQEGGEVPQGISFNDFATFLLKYEDH